MRAIDLDRHSPWKDWRTFLLFAPVDTFMPYDAPPARRTGHILANSVLAHRTVLDIFHITE